MKRVLSGMQPSGKPHLGNYLGAMQHHINFAQKSDYECFYFIANYHALTTVRDSAALQKMTTEVAMDYLALGLDPEKAVFFRQSDVPEVTELTWILDCITHIGILERAHAWKDAKAKGKKETTMGLFNYPMLMAADILIYQSHLVPVGQDQKQHIEMARDIAQNFNHTFGNTFTIPEPHIKETVAVIPGTDGQKMSKSYRNTIDIFADELTLKQQIFSIKTDSKGINEPKNPNDIILFQLYKFFAQKKDVTQVEHTLKHGGLSYGELKKMLLTVLLDYFAAARQKRSKLEKQRSYIDDVLREGAKKARKAAQQTIEKVRRKTGLS